MFEEEEDRPPNPKEMPVYQKAIEIQEISRALADCLKDELEAAPDRPELVMAEQIIEDIKHNSMIIPAKIAGAVGADIYDLQMESATLVRKAAREISVNCSGLGMVEIGDVDYLKMLKDEIEEFRVEFAEWVKTFDLWNYNIDRWGLFNPPGINYDDHDPDDDLPPMDDLGL